MPKYRHKPVTDAEINKLKHTITNDTLVGKPTITGRRSVKLADSPALFKYLPVPQKDIRSMGLEYFVCHDPNDPSKSDGMFAIRKTWGLYSLGIVESYRKKMSLPVTFRKHWRPFFDFVGKFTRKLFSDQGWSNDYCTKLIDLNLYYMADMDKIWNLGPNAWAFVIGPVYRDWINRLLEFVATGQGMSADTKRMLQKYDTYINASGKRVRLCPIQMLLMLIDTYNTAITKLVQGMNPKYKYARGFLNNYKWSKDFIDVLKQHYDPKVIDDYFNRIAKNPTLDGFCI